MSNINSYGFPFNSVAGDRQYGANDWRDYFKLLGGNGVVIAGENELTVTESSVPAKTVQVDTGAIVINGAMLYADTITELTFTDNTSGNTRIDRVIARLDYDNRLIELAVLEGTPSVSPVAPALTQSTTTVWELSLAQVELVNAYTTITNSEITDERSNTSVCGYTTLRGLDKIDKIETGTNGKTYGYTRTQTSGSTATQGSLEIETIPTENSTNLITSGAVYSKDIKLVEVGETITSENFIKIINNKAYNIGIESGSTVQFESGNINFNWVTQIDDNKFIVCYTDVGNSNYGTACVLSISGTTVTAGTPVVFESSSTTASLSVCKLDTNKALVSYYLTSNNNIKGCVLNISGTTITPGTSSLLYSSTSSAGNINLITLDTNKALFSGSVFGEGKTTVLTVSGNTITVNTTYVFGSSSNCNNIYSALIDTDKVLIVYNRLESSASFLCKVINISGTTLTLNTQYTINNTFVDSSALTKLDTNKVLVLYRIGTNIYSQTITISGTTPSTIDTQTLFSNVTGYLSLCKVDTNRCICTYTENTTTIGKTSLLYYLGGILVSSKIKEFYSSGSIASVLAYVDLNKAIVSFGTTTGKTQILTADTADGYALTGQIDTSMITNNNNDLTVIPYLPLGE